MEKQEQVEMQKHILFHRDFFPKSSYM